ncbi:MAG: biotin-dependent carboxyltransferase [Gammaproteobacteria bacterium]|nr:biotin-dependent carboxyltransferase [Gammaproteobacteria bacterium]
MSKEPLLIADAFFVEKAGMLTLLQDAGRFGQANLGLTHGGPADAHAFYWANRLLDNAPNSCALEITVGGLILKSNISSCICLTGANIPLKINGQLRANWQTHQVKKGDMLEFGFAESGIKAYMAVAGGFQVDKQFGSVSTVVRESVGGLSGLAIQPEDKLPAYEPAQQPSHKKQLEESQQPNYSDDVLLRVVLGYQVDSFSKVEQLKFLTSSYQVSKQWDRMGYRLEGEPISSTQTAMLSEGIALGAVQIPPDGQPIILMHDRQTIGGYPKIGSVFSLDLNKLAQCGQGTSVSFKAITMEDAHNELHLDRYRFEQASIIETAW